MSRFDWLPDFLAKLEDASITAPCGPASGGTPASLLVVDAADWGRVASVAISFNCRLAGLWGDQREGKIMLFCCLERQGDYLLLRTAVPLSHPELPSHTFWFPSADRLERHARDLLGVIFTRHPDSRRWTRHRAWPETDYPLRSDFPAAGRRTTKTPQDEEYPFLRAKGTGVYEIPVGPVHAGIIEPGHFRFQAVGEEVLNLEERLGYLHKGIEKIAVGRDSAGLARLAGRVSGDSTVAHAWAACQAMERAAGIEPPPRGLALRALLAERERIANHLGDIGAICNDVGFAFALYQFSRLREIWQRRSAELFGHRLLMDRVVPGGVGVDLESNGSLSLREDHRLLRKELNGLFDILEDHPSLEDRLLTTGRLTAESARSLGSLGYVGKASGQGFDVRHNNPYAPYDRMEVAVPVFEEGDVAARVRVRMEEVRISLDLLDCLLAGLPAGEVRQEMPSLISSAEGVGFVEGWRGEIITYVRFDGEGRVARFFPRDPSWFTWPALERIVLGNIVPDFPVCNKSVNGSYSGHDL